MPAPHQHDPSTARGPATPDWMYLAEVAGEGGFSKKVARSLVLQAKLPAKRIGGRYLVLRSDFDELMRHGSEPIDPAAKRAGTLEAAVAAVVEQAAALTDRQRSRLAQAVKPE